LNGGSPNGRQIREREVQAGPARRAETEHESEEVITVRRKEKDR
jgi:hypothetical protein